MTRRLHITALRGNGMTTEYRALEKPHMGSEPWVPETVQAAARVLLEALPPDFSQRERGEALRAALAAHVCIAATPPITDAIAAQYYAFRAALRALAQEDGE